MRKSSKIIVAIAFAGLVVAGGSAFTGTGVVNTTDSSQFIGGTVAQTVTGATLDTVVYGFTSTARTAVNSITLTFTDANADGAVVSLTPAGGTGAFVCENVGATTTMISTCTNAGYTGLTGVSITVADA